MRKSGCTERFAQMECQIHDGLTVRVTDNGAVSEAFAVTDGVKQGCVLAPTLFSLIFPVMPMNVYRDERLEIRIAYRTDGQLLNRRRMHFLSRIFTTTVQELLFANNCTLNATMDGDVQESMNLFAAAFDKSGLIISTETTVFVHQAPPNAVYVVPQINVNGANCKP
ncbi:hypothetical protein SprV_0401505500 [Sparganum proliferum]